MTQVMAVWLANLNWTPSTQLTVDGAWDSFDWSPGGDKIVYTRYCSSNWGYDNGTLWIVDLTSMTELQLTFNDRR